MMSRTGSSRAPLLGSNPGHARACGAGFTLVEVMVAAALLSLSAVWLYQSLFISVDAAVYGSNRLATMLWAQAELGRTEESLLAGVAARLKEEEGTVALNGRDFSWKKTLSSVDDGLYSTTLSLSWKESGKERRLSFSTMYASS